MKNNKKRLALYATTIVCSIFAITFIYSCSSDDYNYNDKQKNDQNPLIESIIISDEFCEFEKNSELLAEKFEAYTSTLSEEEYDKFMESLNDDDYMEDFIQKANLEKELQQMDEAKENLIRHTGFSRLNEEERNQLFRQYAESRELSGKKLLKTRTEGDTNSCEAARQAAYTQAKTDYDNAIIKCRTESSTNQCYINASAKYSRNKRVADREYENCVKS